MKICHATLKAVAPYSSSRAHETEKLPKETAQDFEERTWRNKAHVKSGKVYIPPMAFKMGLDRAAKMIGRQIPGKGKATYTKFFESGVICTDPVFIADESDIGCERVYANADGVRGSGKRVWRLFPRIDEWEAVVTFYVMADEITTEVFDEHLKQAGAFVGVGRFRPERGGFFGRYAVKSVKWETA
jgi:hypothetical protein